MIITLTGKRRKSTHKNVLKIIYKKKIMAPFFQAIIPRKITWAASVFSDQVTGSVTNSAP
jgi:hypothetical protein